MSALPPDRPVALLVARAGGLPSGAAETVAEAGGLAIVVGSGVGEAAAELTSAEAIWCAETGAGLRAAALTQTLVPLVQHTPLLLLPGGPDGRDLAPRLAAALGWPLLAQAVRVHVADGRVHATVLRLDGRAEADVSTHGATVATLVPGVRSVPLPGVAPQIHHLDVADVPPDARDPEVLEVLEPDPATADLAEARRVIGGGAGLVGGADDDAASAAFDLLIGVGAALGASAGATRVVTDAGWMSTERQIGTTGIALSSDLYIAFGISGATQHTGGLGHPRHIVSINTDRSCPMTAMADVGLVADAHAVLLELAARLGVADER